MGALRHRLKASSLIETIVASVIFLVIFGIGLTSLTGITAKNDDAFTYIMIDTQVKKLCRELISGGHDHREFETEYSWGVMKVSLVPYRQYLDMTEVVVCASVARSGKKIVYRYIIEADDEE